MSVQHYIGNNTGNRHRRHKIDKAIDLEEIPEVVKRDGDLSKYLRIRSTGLRYEHPKIMRRENEVYSYHHQTIKENGCCLVCMEDIKRNNTFGHYCGLRKSRPIIRSCCKQYYHIDCYFNWLGTNHICPICKKLLMTIVVLKSSNGRYKVDSYRTSSYECYDCYGNELNKSEFLKRTKLYKVIYLHK